jgi:polyhydroxybutyrate depolymerase
MRIALSFVALAALLAAAGCGEDSDAPSSGATVSGSGASTSANGSGGTSSSSENASSGSTSTGTTSGVGGAGGSGAGGSGGGGGGPTECQGKAPATGKIETTVTSSGGERRFFVHVPPGYDPDQATMLVLNFHGLAETATDFEGYSQMTPVADAHDFIVVYPDALVSSWNAGECCGTAQQNDVDDVQFTRDMLDAIEETYCIDPKRIYTAGFSNGGMLSYRLGCEMADKFAAIGAVSGTLNFAPCTPSRYVPAAHFHGTSDFVVPYDDSGFSMLANAEETVEAWRQLNACADSAPTVYDTGDSSCIEYDQCADDARVRFCTVDGGGHQWPGGESAGPGGHLTQDISASEELWSFFAAHPMP